MTTRHVFKGSSSLASAYYKPEDNALHITFLAGGTHEYKDVPREVYDGLVAAESGGKFFHSHIRGKYASEKV